VTEHGPATTWPVGAQAPLVTVVIPTHGRPALLRETLDTITVQDYA
jgi:hypothetical protein